MTILYSSGNSLIGNEYTQDFREIASLEKVIGNKAARLKNADTYVASNAVGFKPFDLSKAKVEPINDLRVRYPTKMDGGTPSGFVEENVNLSKEDLYKFALVEKNRVGGLTKLFMSRDTKDEAESALKSLTSKFGAGKVNAISKKLAVGPSANLGIEDIFGARNAKMMDLVDNDDYNKTVALKEQYFKNIGSISVPKGYTLYKDKPEQAKNLASKLASVASDYAGIDEGYEDFAALATDEKSQFQVNVDPAVSRYDRNAYTLQGTKPTGEIITKSITEDQFKYLTGRSAPMVSVDEVDSNIDAFGTGSTNSTYSYMDKDAYSTAYLKTDDFPNTNRFRVSADFAPGTRGRYFPKLYVNTGKEWDLVQYNPGPGFQGFTKDEVANFPMMVDDIFINSLLQRK
jgi:hypothetical protein